MVVYLTNFVRINTTDVQNPIQSEFLITDGSSNEMMLIDGKICMACNQRRFWLDDRRSEIDKYYFIRAF